MRRILTALAFVFALAFTLGAVAPGTAEAAGGGGSNCFFSCSCSGQPLYCCKTATGGVACKPATGDVWACPQVYNC